MTKLPIAILFSAGMLAATAEEAVSPAKPETSDELTQVKAEVETLKGELESLKESYLETKGIADKLSKIKMSGYIQTQWQYSDSIGLGTALPGSLASTNLPSQPAGGAFPANSRERFQLRRARLKTTYETATSKYVLQFDVLPTGLGIKDASVSVMEPWLKTFSATAGVCDRPFGFEIGYSSSSRESPERSRVYQTVFPGERDLGAKLEVAYPSGFLQYFNFKGGYFTGMGPTANEIDNNRDMIGRAGFGIPLYDLNLAIDGGFSAYLGSVTAVNDTVFNFVDTSFTRSTGKLSGYVDRKVMGVDAQVYYDLPVIGGLSLRGEYLWGEMPGTSGANGPYGAAVTPIYNRKFSGWYAILVQNLGKKVQAVVKYDVFDPNTEIDGEKMRGSLLRPADIMFSTLGLGALFYWDENVRLTAYYDIIANEEAGPTVTGALAPYKQDLADNVFTLRAQVKF